MKKLLFLPFAAFALIILVVVWFYLNSLAPSSSVNYKNFEIKSGETGSQVGIDLEGAGFVRSALAFKLYIQFTGAANRIRAGEYRISPSFNLFQIVGVLTKGPIDVWVTIPEGFRREEIASKVTAILDQDQTFFNEFLKSSSGLEGYLFPDTYLLPKEASPSSVVGVMKKTFDLKTSGLSSGAGLSFGQRIILASIIERETKTPEERPIVAGILVNRLDAGMPLQVDASVQYAVATSRCKFAIADCSWWQPLTESDLRIKSPYNTYLNVGLPPTPIANPGLSSIQAAFSPASTDYYYYLHDSSGQIHFARTLDEQNANIVKYLH